MEILVSLIYLSAGLFMGWSLGGNDVANIFGTAVESRTVKFKTAAILASIFVIIGVLTGGKATSDTLSELGSINAIGGAFTVSASAAVTVMIMTKMGLLVSTSQAIVGAIIGWNLFSGNKTKFEVLSKIIGTWIFTPILSAIFAILFYWIIKLVIYNTKMNLFHMYQYTKIALILSGAFGSYSIGANNIANVMGVYINVSPLRTINLTKSLQISGEQQLFLLGGIAIVVGILTFSKKIMMTAGSGIFKLSPLCALIALFASSLVLFLFSNEGLHVWLTARNLPAFPMVPVSQSQAVVGAIIGIGIARGAKNIHLKQLGQIGLGWILTPTFSMILAYIALFFMQNVFVQKVFF